MSSASVFENDDRYEIADSPPLDALDSIVRLVAAVCGTPVAQVTMVDRVQNRVVASVGTDMTSAPRDTSFCVQALERPQELMVVSDAQRDPRFCDNPLVVRSPHFRFYAGIPLVASDGLVVGTVCVLDVVPRTLSEDACTALRIAARCVMAILEERRTSLRLEAALAEKRANASRIALLESVAVNANDGVLVLEKPAKLGDVPTVAFANASVSRLTNWLPEKTREPIEAGLWAAIAEHGGLASLDSALQANERYTTEALVRCGDGRATLLGLSFSPITAPDTGATMHWLVLMRDLSERSRADAVQRRAATILARNGKLAAEIERRRDVERRLTFAVAHDSLTNLPNRMYFVERLRARFATARSRSSAVPFAVMFVDIDRFKHVNDTLGHMVGDDLLVTISRRLQGCVRVHDVVARLGGDEFTILIDAAVDRRTVSQLAERIGRAVAMPCRLERNDVNVSASIGIVFDDGSHTSAEDILRDADIAMFEAKAAGRNRHEFFREELRARVIGEARLEHALRAALERNEFHLAYQPIVALGDSTATVRGFEALLRWNSPYQAEIGTLGIVTAAEENGLIVRIGHWAIVEACRQVARWKATLPPSTRVPYVTVNVSPRQLLQSDFAATVERAIGEAGITPSDLALEVTENAMMHDAELIMATLSRLRVLGVHVYLDHFGTGYASLNYLRRFGVDWLKIDRSFVGGQPGGLSDETIVDAIISFAHRLGIKTVAEGVETGKQIERLIALGCECAQGLAFSPPVDAAKATRMLALASYVTQPGA